MITRLKKRFRQTVIGRSTALLSRQDLRKVIMISLIQVSLGILDLAGVASIGILGALAVTGVEGQKPGNRVNSAIQFFHISGYQFQVQVALLGIAAGVFLISRTLLSVFFTRRTLFFLSRRGAEISSNLIARLLGQSLLTIQRKTAQETLYAVTRGVEAITLQVLGTIVALISDISLLAILAIGLFFVDPGVALGTTCLFGLIGFGLHRFMRTRALNLGIKSSGLEIRSNEKIVEVLNSYRESVVRNSRSFYAKEIRKLRIDLSSTLAERAFMPNVSKYVIDTTVVIGALLLGATQFLLQDAKHAVATLSVFLAAGARIAPAVLRTQQGLVQIKGSLGQAGPTLDLIDSLQETETINLESDSFSTDHSGFFPEVKVSGVSLTYPGKHIPSVQYVTLSIPAHSVVAFVGPSGAGKTSLIDIILGVLRPDSGEVTISGLPPLEAFAKWKGAASYVPQDVMIANGTIRENVGLGFASEVATDELVENALLKAQLLAFVKQLPNGLDTTVGERGAKISGGQRQRLGIARSMFTEPQLLVLDEATSSLDGETEASISEAIQGLKGSVTVLMIAHRLSTVRNADLVVYMDSGKVIATGTFAEVRDSVPDFDRQAKLMGL